MPYFLILFAFLLLGCNEPDPTPTPPTYKQIKEPMIEANKRASKFEQQSLEKYVERQDWPNAQKTGTGLWISIYDEKKSNRTVQYGDRIKVYYTVRLLDGSTVYKITPEEGEWVNVANDQKESGLHEGLQLMREGESAYMAIPSHLAHGLLGDRNQIPMKSPIIYRITVQQIQ
ncbi:MAG: FKBP-type peptidyl-prolyl cis-trans isomerase [Luteibaculaceae bacterium]